MMEAHIGQGGRVEVGLGKTIEAGLGILRLGGCVGQLALWKGRRRNRGGHRNAAGRHWMRCLRLRRHGQPVAWARRVGPECPFFGRLQARGIVIGQAIRAVGFLLMIPFRRKPIGK
jgi:hypothetical protein